MDVTNRANAALSAELAALAVRASHCRDCGARCAWVQSKRANRWYLADATSARGGRVIPQPHRPHFKTCGDKQLHGLS